MIRRISIAIFFIVTSLYLQGQINRNGIASIVNYPPQITNGSELNFAVVQDNRGIVYVGNDDKGVLEFDGSEWRSIPISNNSIVRSLACSDEGTVYVGAVNEFGYLAPDVSGKLSYISLMPMLDSAESKFTDVWKTYSNKEKVYFHSHNKLIIYNTQSSNIKVISNNNQVFFGFFTNENYYVGSFLDGLMKLEGDSIFVSVKGGDYYKGKDIFGIASFDDENLLIGVTAFGLSLYNTTTGKIDLEFARPETNEFLNNNFLTNLIETPSGEFIAGTIGGGIALISRDGQISDVVSKDQGLQDQTIYGLYQSKIAYPYSHLWTAMTFGVGKISLESPLREFTEQSGYTGLIHSINVLDDDVFIGTTTGLYKLVTSNDFPQFEKVGWMNRNIFSLIKLQIPGKDEVLISIGEDGLVQINKEGKHVNFEDITRGIETSEKRLLWGYSLIVDPNNPERIIIGGPGSISSLHHNNGKWDLEYAKDILDDEIRSVQIDAKGNIWFGAKLSGLGMLKPGSENHEIMIFDVNSGLPSDNNNNVYKIDGDVLIASKNGIYRIIEQEDEIGFIKDTVFNSYLPEGENLIMHIYEDPKSNIWISYENNIAGWNIALLEPEGESGYKLTTKPFYGLENFSTDNIFSSNGNDIWISKSNKLYYYDRLKSFNEDEYIALIRKVTVDYDSIIFFGAYPKKAENGSYRIGEGQDKELIPSIKYTMNDVEFRWSSPYFDMEEETEFSYFLEGFSKDWSAWESVLYQDFTNLPQGSYTFRIKARNVYQDESREDVFYFVIERPWYLTFIAFFAYFIAAVLIVYLIIALYTRRLKNENIRLEGIIQERTAEIMKQKEELTDSIEYASRIQRALLPPEKMLDKHDLDHFILFMPRDIVSGDFYWFGNNNDKIFIVAADCTGHGVPGAFMSMLGISFLDEIVIKSGISETNKILDALRNHVITSLRQTGKSMDESTKDGMDLSMIALDLNDKSIQYSGAYNPLYAVRSLNKKELEKIDKDGDLELERGSLHNDSHILIQYKADLMPIGISEKEAKFSSTKIDEPGSTIYLFSDGFVDQFGGPSGKKFMSKNFKKLLLDIQKLSMEQQRQKLDETLKEWMSNVSQIDDILVIGIRI